MAAVSGQGDDSGSMTPSEESDERSEKDSDYETDSTFDRFKSREKFENIQWTGYGRKIPVILFKAEAIFSNTTDFRTVGEQYHLTFKFASTECKIIRNILQSHGFIEAKLNSIEYNLIWSNSHLKPPSLRMMSEFQKINHFPRSYELTRKDRLYKNVQRMQQTKGHRHFDFIPPSFILPGDYQEFCSTFMRDKGVYIVKPVASSRGRGVFLINHPDQIPIDESLIVSRYVSSPLIIDGYKFDIRVYVAVTSYDPLVIYMYEEGLTRFATVRYEKNVKHMKNQCMHLTNYSINKKSQDYVRNDDPDVEDYGNKWSMGAMLRHLRSEGKDTAALMMRIENAVIRTILSVESAVASACKMFQPHRGNCFELYGFDILLDETLKPWVLEVNLSPSLACDTPLDLKIKSNMLCDLFSLAGIICRDPSKKNHLKTARQASEMAATLRSKFKLCSHLAATSASNNYEENGSMSNLNSEEIKILRRVKEEESRKGGWIRIFPNADSWDMHGAFMQFATSHNLMLHKRLYPDRHLGPAASKSGTSTVSTSPSKTGLYLQVTGFGKVSQEKFIESYARAIIRARQYERRLDQIKRSHRLRVPKRIKREHLAQGLSEAEDNDDAEREEESALERIKKEKVTEVKSEPKDVPPGSTGVNQTEKQSAVANLQISLTKEYMKREKKMESINSKTEVGVSEKPDQSCCPHLPFSYSDVIDFLEKGHTFSEVQARTAFAMYLIQVQQRLLSDCSVVCQEKDVKALTEQMELVLRFLKRASANLPQKFHIVVPSKKLPLPEKRRLLAKQLGDFVHFYTKETDSIKIMKKCPKGDNKKTKKSTSCEGLNEHHFDQFVYTANERELEAVLTVYARNNKSATVFLGGELRSACSPVTKKQLSLIKREVHHYIHDRSHVDYRTESAAPMADVARTRQSHDQWSRETLRALHQHSLARHCHPSRHHLNQSHLSSPTVAVYTQKLGRPVSATCSGSSFAGLNSATRPASAAVCHNLIPSLNSVSGTTNPNVDTHNEKALQDALQQLAVKHQLHKCPTIVTKPEAGSTKKVYYNSLSGSSTAGQSSSANNRPLCQMMKSPKPPSIPPVQKSVLAPNSNTEDVISQATDRGWAGASIQNSHVSSCSRRQQLSLKLYKTDHSQSSKAVMAKPL